MEKFLGLFALFFKKVKTYVWISQKVITLVHLGKSLFTSPFGAECTILMFPLFRTKVDRLRVFPHKCMSLSWMIYCNPMKVDSSSGFGGKKTCCDTAMWTQASVDISNMTTLAFEPVQLQKDDL